MITTFLSHLSHDFNIKDLGELHFFLGVELQKTANGLFFNQSKYDADILSKAKMLDANSVASPMSMKNCDIDATLFSNP